MRILISRTDKIGDVVLSLPVAQTLKAHFPDSEISYLVRQPLVHLVQQQPYIDHVIPYNNRGFMKSVRMLKHERFDIAFLLYPGFSLSLMFFCARIPKRIGTGYRWYSLFLNRRVYEHRKLSDKHEIEYNLRLLMPLGIKESLKAPALIVSEEMLHAAAALLKEKGIDNKEFIVIHPGSGGSTLSWPLIHFKKLIRLVLEETRYSIVLSGTKQEYEQSETIRDGYNGRVINFSGLTNLSELAGIIARAKLFIGNSTGPMHIASAVKTDVVAFFPPSRINRKTRWRPLTTSLVFEPPVPECKRCLLGQCKHYNCLSLISPEVVMERIKNWKR